MIPKSIPSNGPKKNPTTNGNKCIGNILRYGKNIIVLNTKQNLKSIDNFTKSRDNVFFLDVKGGKTIQSNVIGKSPLFGGAGKGAGATGATANGEALQCLYLAALQGEGIKHQFSHFTPELLKKYARRLILIEPLMR